ncbi:MAG: ATP-binding cassette domain-containing protein [Candidatus Malihini olakiniferum]
MSQDSLLDVKDLRLDLTTARGTLHVVHGIDFSVCKGEMLCLMGESGCGKSMTSLALMGLLPRKAVRNATHFRFKGQDLQALNNKKIAAIRGDQIAMIFQEPMTSLNSSYTLGEQLCETLHAHHKRQPRQESEALLMERVVSPVGRRSFVAVTASTFGWIVSTYHDRYGGDFYHPRSWRGSAHRRSRDGNVCRLDC